MNRYGTVSKMYLSARGNRMKKPPKIAEWVLRIISKPEDRFSVVGDFEEIYAEIARNNGVAEALKWYSRQILKSLPMFFLNTFVWGVSMFNNYLKIACRNMKKYAMISLIKIVGLSVGMACAIFILIWARNEISYDRFHEHADEICRVVIDTEQFGKWPVSSIPMPQHLKTLFRKSKILQE